MLTHVDSAILAFASLRFSVNSLIIQQSDKCIIMERQRGKKGVSDVKMKKHCNIGIKTEILSYFNSIPNACTYF